MDLTRRETLGNIIAVTILEAATVEHVVEWRGQEIGVVAIAVTGKEIVFIVEGVVDANIELIFSFAALRIGQIVSTRQIRSGSIAVFVPLLPVNLLVGCPVEVVPMGTLHSPPLYGELFWASTGLKISP